MDRDFLCDMDEEEEVHTANQFVDTEDVQDRDDAVNGRRFCAPPEEIDHEEIERFIGASVETGEIDESFLSEFSREESERIRQEIRERRADRDRKALIRAQLKKISEETDVPELVLFQQYPSLAAS